MIPFVSSRRSVLLSAAGHKIQVSCAELFERKDAGEFRDSVFSVAQPSSEGLSRLGKGLYPKVVGVEVRTLPKRRLWTDAVRRFARPNS